MRRLALLLLAVVLACGTAAAAWTDTLYYDPGGIEHTIHSDGSIDSPAWAANATITTDLGDVGEKSTPTVFEKDGTRYLISGSCGGSFYGYDWDGSAWQTNTTIVSGLVPPLNGWTTPTAFEKDGNWYLIFGSFYPGTFYGYDWDGSAWQTNATIVSGLSSVRFTTPTVFEKDGTRYLISGSGGGSFYGYDWDGSAWQTNATILSCLSYVHFTTPTVFEKDGTRYLISGSGGGSFYGYDWDGSAWQTNTTIVSGLASITYAQPEVFEKDGTLYLIVGAQQGMFYGYDWDGSAWQTNATIVSGLVDVGWHSAPSVFQKDSTWYLITGSSPGIFTGYHVPQNTHWTAAALSSEATLNLTYYNATNLTIAAFTLTSGTLDWLTATNLTAGNYYSIASAGGDPLETQQAAGTTITFTTNLPVGEYIVSKTSYTNETGVHGIVYEGTTETNAPIPSVVVTIYNSTWSDTTITDSSGYYIFAGLSNDTYILTFTKDRYVTVDYQYVTPTSEEMYSKDIWMQRDTGQFYSRPEVTFCVCNMWGGRYVGVDVIAYIDEIIAETGETGSDGSVVLPLFGDILYRLTFTNATQGISESLTLYPRDDYYYIIVGDTSTWTDHEHILHDEIHITVAKRIINDTHVWINVTYSDNLLQTTELDTYINETNLEDPANETQIAHHTFTGNLNDTSHNFTVPMAGGQAYFVRLHHEHTEFGSTWFSYAVRRAGMLVDLGIPSGTYIYICIILILFVGAMFGGTTATTGAVSICVLGWLFLAFGWLQPAMGIFVPICVSAASVYAVSVAIIHRQRKAGYA